MWLPTIFFLIFGFLTVYLYVPMVKKHNKMRKILKQQGINGPPQKFLVGNVLEIRKSMAGPGAGPQAVPGAANLFPFLVRWRKQYGDLFTFSLGSVQVLHVSDPNVVKELATTTAKDMSIPAFSQKTLEPLFGKGILTSNGPTWVRQRKIIAPEFLEDKVRGMINIVGESANKVVDAWKQEIEASGGGVVDVDVVGYMKRFAGEIICRACFGSDYKEGQGLYLMFADLQELVCKTTMSAGVPGLRYVPTETNRKIWALKKEVGATILKLVKERQKAEHKNDTLQALIEEAKGTYSTSVEKEEFIVDSCRNIYLAGSDAPTYTASWCLMLLAMNPDWQTRVRDEVERVCHGQVPDDIDMLRKMKQLHMVIQEAMRLYPQAPLLTRTVVKDDATIGGVRVPKGMDLWASVAMVHMDPDIWGPDVLEFRPERFQNGITGACKIPNCYMPFGFGHRVCVGQHLAMAELKLLMALIVSNFTFTLSPDYVHEPVMTLNVIPKHGINILINKI